MLCTLSNDTKLFTDSGKKLSFENFFLAIIEFWFLDTANIVQTLMYLVLYLLCIAAIC